MPGGGAAVAAALNAAHAKEHVHHKSRASDRQRNVARHSSVKQRPGHMDEKLYCDREAMEDDAIRALLQIKPSHSTYEGSIVFIQRYVRKVREDRFRVAASDCIRVGEEITSRRDGLHSLCKYMLFMLLFIAMLALQKSPARALSVESALRDQFENVDQAVNENWLDVSNFEELGDWIVVAIENLHIAKQFQSWGQYKLGPPEVGTPPVRGQISSFNNVVSGLVLLQRRGTVVDCAPQSSRIVGAYLNNYAPYCYTDIVDVESYGPPPLCVDATAAAAKVDPATGYIRCIEVGEVFDPDNTTVPHAGRYTYSDVSKGYVQIIDLGSFGSTSSEAQAKWSDLVATHWLDKQSREMAIMILTYNANTGLWGIGTVTFKLDVGGVFKRSLSVESYVVSNQYAHTDDFIRLVIEIIFFSWCFFSIAWEFCEMRTEGCNEYWCGSASVWNYIDWMAQCLLMMNLVLWVAIVIMTALWSVPDRPTTVDADAVNRVETILSNFDSINIVYSVYGGTNVMSLLFMIVRLLKSLNYHPKLAIVSNTISIAAEDLMHFAIVFSVVLCVYAFMGMVIAGRQMVEFATFDRALINLVLISMGEFSAWEELYLISPIVGSAFFFSYVAVVTVLMMNITLSIVVESFVGAAAQSDGATSVFADAFVSIMIDVHLALKCAACQAPLCNRCRPKEEEDEPSDVGATISVWMHSPSARPKGCRAFYHRAVAALWKCPNIHHKMLPDALNEMSESEFIVNVELPIKFLKTTLSNQGVPEWALSIIVDKFIRPRKGSLTWGDQAPEWWPENGRRYEPSHIRMLPLPKRRRRLTFVEKISAQMATEDVADDTNSSGPPGPPGPGRSDGPGDVVTDNDGERQEGDAAGRKEEEPSSPRVSSTPSQGGSFDGGGVVVGDLAAPPLAAEDAAALHTKMDRITDHLDVLMKAMPPRRSEDGSATAALPAKGGRGAAGGGGAARAPASAATAQQAVDLLARHFT